MTERIVIMEISVIIEMVAEILERILIIEIVVIIESRFGDFIDFKNIICTFSSFW